MKKNILFLMLLGLFVACVNRNVPNENDKGTVIDPSECYLIQTFNELGEPVEAYDCMTFDKKAGYTFEEAFTAIKPELDELVQRMVNDEKDGANYDAEKWELRQIVRDVKNSPNESLVYTSIELYMFSKVFRAYTIVYQFLVIDSEGNLYQISGPTGGED